MSSPNAETLPGSGGTTTARTPRMSSSRQASSEPDPPNVVSTKSRTSRPRFTLTWRRALAWFQAEISRMPRAQAAGSRPSLPASAAIAPRAAAASSGI